MVAGGDVRSQMSGSDWNMQDRVLPHTRERREVDRRAGEGWDAWGGDHFLGQSSHPVGQHGYLADGSWTMGKPTEERRVTDVFERRQPRRHLPASRFLPVLLELLPKVTPKVPKCYLKHPRFRYLLDLVLSSS